MAEERLQKVLARAGIASRRAAEELITKGRVKVDGRVVDQLGVRVDPRKAKVEVDGNRLMAEPLVYIVLHKPRGVMCTLSDPEGRPTVAELLKAVGVRVVPVGRLDFHTSGALLCTNDGEFSNALAHPRNKAQKVYVAKVQGLVHDEQLLDWRKSIEIDGRATAPAEVRRLRYEGDKTWLELTLREGRNRQVRRLGEATGSLVMRLARISHAGVTAEDLRPGQWRHLSLDELVVLKRDFGVPQRVRAPGTEAWEIQVKANAKVPRVAAPKRSAEEPHARSRREPGTGKDRNRAQSAEPRGGRDERPRFREPPRSPHTPVAAGPQGDRFARPSNARPERSSNARPERSSNARPERSSNARPERSSNARPERSSNARPERNAASPRADRSARPERSSNARPERSSNARPERNAASPRADRSARPERGSKARPEQRPTRDAAQTGPSARVSSRGVRASSRRRGT
ncbi:MAG: pseudouridine synthase [Pseudomonadota bacterium]